MTLPPGRLTADELALGRRIRAGIAALLASPTPTAVGLTDGRILIVNDALVSLSGYDRNALLGVSGAALLVPRQREAELARGEAVLASARDPGSAIAEAFHHTITLLTSDGREVDVRASSTLLRSREGAPMAFVTRLVPVSPADTPPTYWAERLGEADAALLAMALLEIPTFDDQAEPSVLTSGRGIILRVNRAFAAAFGWANRDVVGLPGADLLASNLRTWADERLEEIAGAPLLPRPAHPRLRHRDGSTVPVETSPVPVRDESGSTRYIVATVLRADIGGSVP